MGNVDARSHPSCIRRGIRPVPNGGFSGRAPGMAPGLDTGFRLERSHCDRRGFHYTLAMKTIQITIRGAPSEVIIGVDEGLKKDSAVNLDHVQTVAKSRLKRFVGLQHVRRFVPAFATLN